MSTAKARALLEELRAEVSDNIADTPVGCDSRPPQEDQLARINAALADLDAPPPAPVDAQQLAVNIIADFAHAYRCDACNALATMPVENAAKVAERTVPILAAWLALHMPPPPPADREALGKQVREIWIEWAREQPNPKASWLVPWEGLSEPDREVDRRIGEGLAANAEIWSQPDQQALQAELQTARAERDAANKRADHLAAFVGGPFGNGAYATAELRDRALEEAAKNK